MLKRAVLSAVLGFGCILVLARSPLILLLGCNWFAKAIATFYDASGTVVGEEWDYTEPSDINSNQTAAFDIELIYTQQVMKVALLSMNQYF
jgi:hypothetical protein